MISVNPRLYDAIYRLALLLCFGVISWLAFGTAPSGISAAVSDKVLHAGAFVVLSYLLDGALSAQSFWKTKLPLLLGYGLFIELVQGQLPYRDFSMLDFLADAGGIAVYWVCHKPIWKISELFLKKTNKKLEIA